MSNGSTNISTVLAPAVSGTPLTPAMQASILSAADSGAGTATYIQNQTVLNNFTSFINQLGDAAWATSTDANGPVYFAEQQGSDGNMIYLTLSTVPDTDVLNGSSAPPRFTYEGQTYNIVGSITGTFSYNEEPSWYVDAPLAVVELVPIAALAKIGWSNLASPVLTGFWGGIKKCFSSGAEADGLAEVDGVAADAAADAAVDGAEVAEDTTLSMVAGGLAFAGVAVLVAIPIVLDMIQHVTYQTTTLYNLTPYDIDWTLGYLNEGVMNAAPVTGQGSTTLNPLIPAMTMSAPPGVTPVMMASEAGFSFTSTKEYEGLGYVLSFTLKDHESGDAVATAAAMYDVPFSGDNSLYAAFNPTETPQELYDNNQNVNEVTELSVTWNNPDASESDPDVCLQVTFDFLSGEHPLPNGQDAYTYQSMCVFSVPSS